MALSLADVITLALNRGASPVQAVDAAAIAMAESSLDPAAVGDTTLEDAEWGPSLGLWQVRSLHAEQGTGQSRDANRLTDPDFNADSAKSISNGWTDFHPWSTFTSGEYKTHLAAAQAAYDALGATPAPQVAPQATTTTQEATQMIQATDPLNGNVVLVDPAGETFSFDSSGSAGGFYYGGLNTHPDWNAGEGKANGPVVGAIFVRDGNGQRSALRLITRDAEGNFHPYQFPSDGSLAK